jgi:hypothetical protein
MALDERTKLGIFLSGKDRDIGDDFGGVDRPKLKFNFTISFEYTDMFTAYAGDDDPYSISFGVKQITRPNPNVIYEDINYYNFMTKVATKMDFGVTTVTLYDDINNKAHNIFKNYIEAISPLANNERISAPLLHQTGQSTSASIGPLTSSAVNGPIKSIRVTHLLDQSGRKVIYDYLNPKIQNVALDELDMTQSDVNTISFTFIYDTYKVTNEGASRDYEGDVGASEALQTSERWEREANRRNQEARRRAANARPLINYSSTITDPRDDLNRYRAPDGTIKRGG